MYNVWCIAVCFCAECPESFTYVSAVKGCYELMDSKNAWSNAAPACQSLDSQAHLVIISSAAEQQAVEKLINNASR